MEGEIEGQKKGNKEVGRWWVKRRDSKFKKRILRFAVINTTNWKNVKRIMNTYRPGK